MKISTLRRSVSGAAAVALLAAGVAIATPASAANLGTVSASPRTGNGLNVTNWNTSGQCPAGNNVVVRVSGGSGAGATLATPQNITPNQAADGFFVGSGMSIPGTQTWADFASLRGLTALNGTYTITAVCSGGDTLTGTVTFSGTGTGSGASYAAPLNTSITLAPIGSAGYGSPVGLSATVLSNNVAPNAVDPAITGTVQFKEGSTIIATGTVNPATGVATASPNAVGPNLGSGAHSITATYVPDSAATTAGVLASGPTAAQSFSVNQGVGTVTVSTASPSAAAGSSVDITAQVGPAAVTGQLVLSYVAGASTTPIVTLNNVSGAAPIVYPWTISAGQAASSGTVVATFTPSDTTNYSTPAPATSPFTVDAAAGVINAETIEVVVPAGALSATVKGDAFVALGNWKLDASGKFNVATGAIDPVKVIDTRAGDLGWTLSAAADDFVGCTVLTAGKPFFNGEPSSLYSLVGQSTGLTPGCDTSAALAPVSKAWQQTAISANNLGITATVDPTATADAQPGTTFTKNDGVVAQPAVQPTLTLPNTAAVSGFGLRQGKNIVVGTGGLPAASGDGAGLVVGSATGVALVQGALTLRVPTVTVAGPYATTLTITLISN